MFDIVCSYIKVNKTKVFYGLLKEPDITINALDDDADDQDGGQNEEGKPPKVGTLSLALLF